MSGIKAVVFDIDGTLSPEISWLSLTRDLGASVEDHAHIYRSYKDGHTDYAQSKQELLELWQATGNATKEYFQTIFDKWPLVEGADALVGEIQHNFQTCLITGSMDLYAETIARKLKIYHYFANTALQWDAAGNLIDMDYELDQANKKLEQFLGYCLANNLQPEECIVVGDSDNDVELFKSSHYGIAVGLEVPEDLAAVCRRKITTLQELRPIVDEFRNSPLPNQL